MCTARDLGLDGRQIRERKPPFRVVGLGDSEKRAQPTDPSLYWNFREFMASVKPIPGTPTPGRKEEEMKSSQERRRETKKKETEKKERKRTGSVPCLSTHPPVLQKPLALLSLPGLPP